jgi:hypothetical protein
MNRPTVRPTLVPLSAAPFVNVLAAIPGFVEEREKEIRILEGRGEAA